MEESAIIIQWGRQDLSNFENYCLTFFDRLFEPSWLQSDFAKYCISTVDKSEYLGGVLINSPWLGPIPPERLSGGTKTLLLAYNMPDKVFPLDNLGDNCGEALYMCSLSHPTNWSWFGYMPPLNPAQRILVRGSDTVVLGKDWVDWCRENAPDPVSLVPGLQHACDYMKENGL